MIFKGNTKFTPALTEILDDTTPSSNKTYSSEKIETLIGGGGGGKNFITNQEIDTGNTLDGNKIFCKFIKAEITGNDSRQIKSHTLDSTLNKNNCNILNANLIFSSSATSGLAPLSNTQVNGIWAYYNSTTSQNNTYSVASIYLDNVLSTRYLDNGVGVKTVQGFIYYTKK